MSDGRIDRQIEDCRLGLQAMWSACEHSGALCQFMKQRCTNPRVASYKYYGARGITVCAAWSKSFVAFIAAVGLRPSAEYSIGRKDNDGNYEPGNVCWMNATDQARNRRPRGTAVRQLTA